MIINEIALGVRFLLEVYGTLAIVFNILKMKQMGSHRYIVAVLALFIVIALWMLFVSPKASIQVSSHVRFAIEIVIIGFSILMQYIGGQEIGALLYILLYAISKAIIAFN
ncbi:YrdB family protein [Erysipelothrix sp. HDW6C]|uniref:YrdB family protein n=1 Tax=Erysipelothrix sp. HDW6C TaxID=2714930 RepID=UPI00140B8566|nr:YrdB family protein [Erysipelothrix sp. HDW6C]QIK69504.1 YrdB family protein [Erysipelothrix sp. HDW6C]